MKRSLFNLTAALTVALAPQVATVAHAQEYRPAVAEFQAAHTSVDRNLKGHVWYPTVDEGDERLLRGSAVWRDITGHIDARIAPGVFPVVLVSHGMYGNSLNQAWLAKRLAGHGIISVMPNHPGTTSFGRDPEQARQLWLRATDLSVSFDMLLSDPRIADHMDPTRVAAIGHSLGGYTVMAAGGARHDVAHFNASCVETPERADCRALDMWKVGHSPDDLGMLQSDRSDPRIRTVIPLDLGGAQAFSPESLEEIAMPVLVLGSGRQDMLDQTVESRALVSALPAERVTHEEIEDAGHFDFMGVCVEGGYDLLKQEEPGDEIVCVQGTQDRIAQHDRIFALIMTHLYKTGVVLDH